MKSKSSVGVDNIPHKCVKKFPTRALLLMLKIYNSCARLSYFPKQWKIGKVIAIPKPKKDKNTPTSYRPITLLCTFSKIFEKLLLLKMLNFEDDNKIIIDQQFGFRSSHNTTHQVFRVCEHITENFNRDNSTGMILLDIEKAFDSVWHDALIYKLNTYKYPLNLIKLIQQFISGRQNFVQIIQNKSNFYHIPAGVPQGSALSPHLFNLFINDIPTPANCHLAIYADDTALYTTAPNKNINPIVHNLERGFKTLEKYFSKWKIKINNEKTEAIIFTHSILTRKHSNVVKIHLNNKVIPWNNSVKYLGINLEPRLRFKLNIIENIKKAKIAQNLLFPLIKKHNLVSTPNKVHIYKSYIRPILTYACPCWSNASKTNINKIQIIQNKLLRMCLNKTYNTRTNKLHVDSKVPYINDFITKITRKFYENTKIGDNPLINNIGNYNYQNLVFRVKHRLIKPMFI